MWCQFKNDKSEAEYMRLVSRPKGIIVPDPITPGTQTRSEPERIEDIGMIVHKFTNRPRPDPEKVVIISCFSEFGCETLGVLYCVPRIMREHQGCYFIAMGWHGREYFYRHLVDEYWEIKEEHQWLREYSRAFHHDSKNLKKLEKGVGGIGKVMTARTVGQYAIGNICRGCGQVWIGNPAPCPKCQGGNILKSMFSDVQETRKDVVQLPPPSRDKLEEARQYLKPRSVGVFARGRKCYGRNLQPEFYVKLIGLLRELGYNPIWLGEKQTTQACPVDDVLDLSRSDKARDLELTLAIVAQLDFTVQFWTASTRLSGMMKVPYLLFESPDQIWGNGQEGYRRNLCDFGPRKLCVSHFKNVYDDNATGIEFVRRCIKEIEVGNYEDVVGMVDTDIVVQSMKDSANKRIGGE